MIAGACDGQARNLLSSNGSTLGHITPYGQLVCLCVADSAILMVGWREMKRARDVNISQTDASTVTLSQTASKSI